MSVCVAVIGATFVEANAQTAAKKNFNIPAGSLSQALAAFGKQSGLQVSYPSELTAGKTSAGASGSLTSAQALSAILDGSGLSYSFANATTVSISGESNGAGATVAGAIALDTIDVSGGGEAAAAADLPYETPGSSAYISAEEINRVPPTSQGDIFKSTPGVVSSGSRTGQGLNVNIRGLQGMNRVATLIDGTQQSSSSYIGYRGQTSSVFIDPDLIGGIDITKGPSDGPLGNGAMGGVVNMRTLNAQDIVAEGQNSGARIKMGVGGNTISPSIPGTTLMRNDDPDFLSGNNVNASFAAATVQDNFELLAAVTRRKSGNYFAGSNGNKTMGDGVTPLSPVQPGHEVFNTSEDVSSLLLKGKVALSEESSLEVGYIRYENEHGELDDFPYVYNFSPLTQRELSHRKTHTLTSKFSYNPADNPVMNLSVSAWMTNIEAESNVSDGNVDVRTYGLEAHNKSSFETAIGHLALNYGAQASLEDADGEEIYMSFPWNPSARFLSYAGPTGKRQLAGLFGRADLDVTDWLSFGGALRYDTYEIEQGPGVLAPYGDKSGERLNPSISVTLKPWDGFQLYGQYVEGWRPPSLREANFILGTILFPNRALEPETAKNYEAGVNVLKSDVITASDSLKIKASYFNNNYENYIIRDSIDRNWTEPRHWANIPSAAFTGFDLSVKYDAKRVFLDGALTKYTDVEFCHQLTGCASKGIGIDYGSNYIPAEYLATLTAGMRFLDEKLTVGSRVTFIGERAVTDMMGGGWVTPTDWPKNTIIDAFGSYELSDAVSLNFSAENITDKYYLDALSLTRIPAPGRTIRTGLTAKF